MENKAKLIVELLSKKGLRISAAESCTGGLFAKLITDVPGSSAVLDVSIVTYANEAKMKFLGVLEETINSVGVVSDEVAAQMAEGVCKLMGADIGVGITGIAGPGGATETKPVGLVCTAICYRGKIIANRLKLSGSREKIRGETCMCVMDKIIELIG